MFTENVELLGQGLTVLADLPREIYGSEDDRSFGGRIGGHFRHCLEFYRLFLSGLESGKLDYDARPRDAALETDPAAARAVLEEIRSALAEAASCHQPETPLEIVENHHGGRPSWSASSIGRELRFLLSHTVHHYALIAILLQLRNRETPENFGIAPSTIHHHVPSQMPTPCAP